LLRCLYDSDSGQRFTASPNSVAARNIDIVFASALCVMSESCVFYYERKSNFDFMMKLSIGFYNSPKVKLIEFAGLAGLSGAFMVASFM